MGGNSIRSVPQICTAQAQCKIWLGHTELTNRSKQQWWRVTHNIHHLAELWPMGAPPFLSEYEINCILSYNTFSSTNKQCPKILEVRRVCCVKVAAAVKLSLNHGTYLVKEDLLNQAKHKQAILNASMSCTCLQTGPSSSQCYQWNSQYSSYS